MTFRSDYIPSETFCFVCGFLIKERQIGDNIQGTITHGHVPNQTTIEPFDGHMCHECSTRVKANIEGGIETARRKSRELQKNDRSQVGE